MAGQDWAATATAKWAPPLARGEDALGELDEILEGPKLSVREARAKLEGLIAWSRSFAPSFRSARIEWVPGGPMSAREPGYREASASVVNGAGVVTIRVRGARPCRYLRGILASVATVYFALLAAMCTRSAWPLLLWLPAAVYVAYDAYPWAHELVLEGDRLRVRRVFGSPPAAVLEHLATMDWFRISGANAVLLYAETDQARVPLLFVSRENTQVSVIPAVWAAHRALVRAVEDRPSG